MKTWTTPADIAAQVERLWNDGSILGARLRATPLFPYTVRFRKPTIAALSSQFDEVRQWIRALEEGSGYRIEWSETNNRQLGRNRVPSGVVIPAEEDALRMIGRRRQADRFSDLATTTVAEFPTLLEWLADKPLVLLEHAEDWERILAVLRWFKGHPRSGLYLRQLDIPSVDTKFIERRRALFIELLDAILPIESVESSASGAKAFERRYGLQSKPPLIRLRILDERRWHGGLADIATPAAHLSRWDPPVTRVFITENEINGLAFPPVPDSLVIFGLGYSIERLEEVPWLASRRVHYWGDVDTHGFAILDHLRRALPDVRSFLMDRDTLLSHRALWVEEEDRNDLLLNRLTEDEKSLYEDLRGDVLGPRIRLEQERIGFGRVEEALRKITKDD